MTRPKALERFKNDLDRYNFCLHQIAEESNIQLSPNIVRQHGYYAPLHVEGFYVLDGEQSYNQDPQRFHAFDDYSNDALYQTLCDFVAKKGCKNGYVLWPVRTAVSGKQMTPAGATEIMEIIGKEEALSRIRAGIALLEQA